MQKRLAVILASLLLTACGGAEYVRPRAAAAVQAAPGQALVVFLRPSGYGGMNRALIFADDGTLLAQSVAESSIAVSLPAGQHFFTVVGSSFGNLGGDPRGFDANLAAGKTYYVEVGAKPAGVTDLFAHAPRMPSWSEHTAWLEKSQPYELNGAKLMHDADDIKELIAEAHSIYASLTADYKKERSLLPDDGE